MLFFGSSCKRVPGAGEVELTNSIDSVSYALGFLEAIQFKRVLNESVFDTLDAKTAARLFSNVPLREAYVDLRIEQFNEFNEEIFRTAFINELAYEKSYFTEMTADVYLRTIFEQKRLEREEQMVLEAQKNAEEGAAFLAKNATREGVIVLPSGLQYEIITQGTGPKPKLTDHIRSHYHGTLLDGTVFDSSIDRGEPVVFRVDQVIPGWTEALQLMPVGSKWRLFIPSSLAYGAEGAGEIISGGETLLFDIELLEIVQE